LGWEVVEEEEEEEEAGVGGCFFGLGVGDEKKEMVWRFLRGEEGVPELES